MDRITCAEHRRYQAGCNSCRTYQANRHRIRTRLAAYGQPFGLVDTTEVRAHALSLQAAGMSARRIADVSGASRHSVRLLLQGRLPKATHDTVNRILAATPTFTARTLVDSTGVARRLQALMAIGWDSPTLAAELGILPVTVRRWRYQEWARISVARRQAFTALYERLSGTVGPSVQARSRAAAFGYAPPLAWDDDTIDDPKAKPLGVRRPVVAR